MPARTTPEDGTCGPRAGMWKDIQIESVQSVETPTGASGARVELYSQGLNKAPVAGDNRRSCCLLCNCS